MLETILEFGDRAVKKEKSLLVLSLRSSGDGIVQ